MKINPRAKESFDRGLAACRAGQVASALPFFATALSQDRDNIELANRIGGVLMSAGAMREALAVLSDCARRFPGDATTHSNLGTVLIQLGQCDLAIAAWTHSLAIDANFVIAKVNLAKLHIASNQPDAAEKLLREVVARDPKNWDAWQSLGVVRRGLGDLTDAIECFERTVALQPADQTTHAAILFCLLFDDRVTWQEVLERHAAWGRQFIASLRLPANPAHSNHRNPDRRLRIGYVSPFFQNHVVRFLTEPVLAEHDRSAFEIFAYCVARPEKSDERALFSLVDHWRQCARLNDEQLANMIRTDGIDVLVDLTAHMESHRMGMFARKPAPVQINYLAYPATTGLPTIDYRVTCPLLDPASEAPPPGLERLLRLPHTFWCYPTTHLVPIGPPPSIANGFVTFGCLNSFVKVRDRCIELWAKILDAVPRSHLMCLVRGGENGRSVTARMMKYGIDSARIVLIDYSSREKYLARFNEIDVSLDTFPYGGHTTTHDSLWMGVPVVVMKGDTPISRAGKCILSQIGLADLVADSAEKYVAQAIELADSVSRRTEWRATLRQRMLGSPLTNAKQFTRNLEAAYRAAWRRWCEGLPPTDLDIPHEINQAS